jgi:hypothetical protein
VQLRNEPASKTTGSDLGFVTARNILVIHCGWARLSTITFSCVVPNAESDQLVPTSESPGNLDTEEAQWYDGLAQLGSELGKRNEVANGTRRLIDEAPEETNLLLLLIPPSAA